MDTSLNIIVVEDNDDLREATVEALHTMGHVVRGVACAEDVDDVVGAFPADVLVVDLNLPGEDGLSLAKRLRAGNPDVGIIMVTARNQVRDITTGYASGADIYLTKPTVPEELGAALQALSRRLRPHVNAADEITIYHVTRQLQGPLAQVDLSQQEYILLAAFAQAHDHSLENWQLIELSGKESDTATKAALEVQIVRLRRKLEQVGAPQPTIRVIRGMGYRLCVPLVIKKSAPI
jgi:DNA-binding response OmpR family regulator